MDEIIFIVVVPYGQPTGSCCVDKELARFTRYEKAISFCFKTKNYKRLEIKKVFVKREEYEEVERLENDIPKNPTTNLESRQIKAFVNDTE